MMTIDQSLAAIESQKAAEALYRQAGELLAPEVTKLSKEGKVVFWRMMQGLAEKALLALRLPENNKPQKAVPPQPPRPQPAKPPRRIRTAPPSDDVKTALQLVDEIEEMAGEVPERGQDFADSVVSRAGEIAETIEERGSVTEAQMTALQNMHSGLQRWIDH